MQHSHDALDRPGGFSRINLLAPLRHRDFRILWAGMTVSLLGDGIFLIENGKVTGAVNNFRWNMSPIAALAQATEIGQTGMALPREHDEFLRSKAPALRIERFNMSSVSQAQ